MKFVAAAVVCGGSVCVLPLFYWEINNHMITFASLIIFISLLADKLS